MVLVVQCWLEPSPRSLRKGAEAIQVRAVAAETQAIQVAIDLDTIRARMRFNLADNALAEELRGLARTNPAVNELWLAFWAVHNFIGDVAHPGDPEAEEDNDEVEEEADDEDDTDEDADDEDDDDDEEEVEPVSVQTQLAQSEAMLEIVQEEIDRRNA